MCNCVNNKNVVNLPHIKLYAKMAEYKVKKSFLGSSTNFGGGKEDKRVDWDTATQEELAYVYEEVNNGSHYVEKINKKPSDESTKKSSEKSSNKKNSKEK